MNWLFRIKPEKIAADLLYEARVELVKHEAAAESSAAMAAMYRARIARLEPRAGESKVGAGVPLSTYTPTQNTTAQHDLLRNAAPEYFNPAPNKKG